MSPLSFIQIMANIKHVFMRDAFPGKLTARGIIAQSVSQVITW